MTFESICQKSFKATLIPKLVVEVRAPDYLKPQSSTIGRRQTER